MSVGAQNSGALPFPSQCAFFWCQVESGLADLGGEIRAQEGTGSIARGSERILARLREEFGDACLPFPAHQTDAPALARTNVPGPTLNPFAAVVPPSFEPRSWLEQLAPGPSTASDPRDASLRYRWLLWPCVTTADVLRLLNRESAPGQTHPLTESLSGKENSRSNWAANFVLSYRRFQEVLNTKDFSAGPVRTPLFLNSVSGDVDSRVETPGLNPNHDRQALLVLTADPWRETASAEVTAALLENHTLDKIAGRVRALNQFYQTAVQRLGHEIAPAPIPPANFPWSISLNTTGLFGRLLELVMALPTSETPAPMIDLNLVISQASDRTIIDSWSTCAFNNSRWAQRCRSHYPFGAAHLPPAATVRVHLLYSGQDARAFKLTAADLELLAYLEKQAEAGRGETRWPLLRFVLRAMAQLRRKYDGSSMAFEAWPQLMAAELRACVAAAERKYPSLANASEAQSTKSELLRHTDRWFESVVEPITVAPEAEPASERTCICDLFELLWFICEL
jgi:hypothetical protein